MNAVVAVGGAAVVPGGLLPELAGAAEGFAQALAAVMPGAAVGAVVDARVFGGVAGVPVQRPGGGETGAGAVVAAVGAGAAPGARIGPLRPSVGVLVPESGVLPAEVPRAAVPGDGGRVGKRVAVDGGPGVVLAPRAPPVLVRGMGEAGNALPESGSFSADAGVLDAVSDGSGVELTPVGGGFVPALPLPVVVLRGDARGGDDLVGVRGGEPAPVGGGELVVLPSLVARPVGVGDGVPTVVLPLAVMPAVGARPDLPVADGEAGLVSVGSALAAPAVVVPPGRVPAGDEDGLEAGGPVPVMAAGVARALPLVGRDEVRPVVLAGVAAPLAMPMAVRGSGIASAGIEVAAEVRPDEVVPTPELPALAVASPAVVAAGAGRGGAAEAVGAAERAPGGAEAPMVVASARLGEVGIGVEGGAQDLRVRMTASAAATGTLAADVPRLVAELAATGVRVQSIDLSARAETGGGEVPQRQAGGDTPQRQPGGDAPQRQGPGRDLLPEIFGRGDGRRAAADRYA